MTKRTLTTEDILQKQFKHSFRGFDIQDVDAFLDIIIRDYETFQKDIAFLRNENERLLLKVDELSKQTSASSATRTQSATSSVGVTNFDILKRLSNLEKHVFGSRLNEDEMTHTDNNDDLDSTRVITPIN